MANSTQGIKLDITPQAAADAGAQWRLDGGSWQNSGVTLTGIADGTHTVQFKDISGWIKPADLTVVVTNGQAMTSVGTYTQQTGSVAITITPQSAVDAGAQWRVDGGSWQNSGVVLGGIGLGHHTVQFKDLAGWTKPSDVPVTVQYGQTATVSSAYTQQSGSLLVTITPAGAVDAGAQWALDNGAWQNSGATLAGVGAGSHTLRFKEITGWTKPADQTVVIETGQAAQTAGSYTLTSCAVKVTLSPQAAVDAGAQWSVDGGAWQNSGATVSGLSGGAHLIVFKPISGWTTPASQSVTLVNGQVLAEMVTYTLMGGSLTVTITPQVAIDAGAQWHVDNGAWNNSGAAVAGLTAGAHTVKFKAIEGWTKPQDQTVTIQVGQSASASGTYLQAQTWTATGNLATRRLYHTATLLPNGKVLVTGGLIGSGLWYTATCELYDPATGVWSSTGSLAVARQHHTATLLSNGKVLVTGGEIHSELGLTETCELYDPTTGVWSSTGSLAVRRISHAATLLPDGRVLAAGGHGSSPLASCELYDPATGVWSSTGSLASARSYHTVTLLSNGKVFAAGGVNGCEIYDPSTGEWSSTGSLTGGRDLHTTTLLVNGKVLVAGGRLNGVETNTCAVFDPSTGVWSDTGSLGATRYLHTATLLPNGKVLVAGGSDENYVRLAGSELYDPATGTWSNTASLITGRWGHTAIRLASGKVLAAAGADPAYSEMQGLTSAELYDPGDSPNVQTGSLTVTILPQGAVAAGAQWQVDGGAWQNSGAVVPGLSVTGAHTVQFKDVTGYNKPADLSVTVQDGQTTSLSETYLPQTSSVKVTISPQAAVDAGAQWQVDGGAWQNSGATVQNLSVLGSHTVQFKAVNGFVKPDDQTVTVQTGQTNTITGAYSQLTSSVMVVITPQSAIDSGAQWCLDGGAWQNSSVILTEIAIGSHTLTFKDISGWSTPAAKAVTVSNGQTTVESGVYGQQTGSLKVTITPQGAITAGARWRVDGGDWKESGAQVGGLVVGDHTVSYLAITGWNKPEAQTVIITNGGLSSVTGVYTLKNRAPAAVDGMLTTNKNTPVSGALIAGDPDGDPLAFSIVVNGTKGKAALTNPSIGTFTYTPNVDASGEDTFTFKASDGTLDSNVATVTVTIREARFVNNLNGTVLDTKTSLLWEQGNNDLVPVWANAAQYCENLDLGDYTDWRLPRVDELLSIVDYSRVSPAIDPVFGSGPMDYWSASSYVSHPASAWTVSSGYCGSVRPYLKAYISLVRCVRGGPYWSYDPSEHLREYSEHTVLDIYNNLVWQKSDDGTVRTWNDAKTYCNTLSLDGSDDWRLPRIEELETIIDFTRSDPSLTTQLFDGRSSGYWSNSTYSAMPELAFGVEFLNGDTNPVGKTEFNYYVRCVREGPGIFGSLTLQKAGTGTGRVVSLPAGIDCGGSCAGAYASYAAGTHVTLTAQGDSGSTFAGWSGGGCSGTGNCVVLVEDGGVSVTAAFATIPTPYSISGTVTTDGGAPLAGVTMALSGSASATTATDVGGAYSFKNLASGFYTVTPSKDQYLFSPPALPVTIGTADQTGHHFTATFQAIGSIVLTEPNGGESWYAGIIQAIEWTYTGSPGDTVKILLVKGGKTVRTIAKSAPIGENGMGSRTWKVPANQEPGDDYKIKIVSTSNSACTDASDLVFSIKAPPPLTLVAPNSGETWQVGSKYTIRWISTVDIGWTVKLELLEGEQVVKTIVKSMAANSFGNGALTWKVPKDMMYGSNYRIRVTSNANTSYTDLSDKAFTITGPVLDVTAPDGGESWPRGSQQTITWTYTGNSGGNVRIELLKAGVLARTITRGTPIGSEGMGSYSWTVPTNLVIRSDFQIKISHNTIKGCTDISGGNFSVTKASLIATAGPDQRVAEAAEVRLSGANSKGLEKDTVSFLWSQLDGPQTELSSPAALEPSFTAPEAEADGQSLTFLLTLTDHEGSESQDSCIVNVTEANMPPTADAGPNQTVGGGERVELDGSASFDLDDGIAGYQWRQLAGPPVSLSDANAVQPTFTAPEAGVNGESLTFQVTVIDQGGLRARDTCLVNVTWVKHPPKANAAPVVESESGSLVVLDGSQSSDPDGNIASVRWRQLAGPPVTLSDPDAARTSFKAPSFETGVEELVFELLVTDAEGLQDKRKVVVTVTGRPAVIPQKGD